MLLHSKIYLILIQKSLIYDVVLSLFISVSLKIFNFSVASGVLLRTLYPSLDSYLWMIS